MIRLQMTRSEVPEVSSSQRATIRGMRGSRSSEVIRKRYAVEGSATDTQMRGTRAPMKSIAHHVWRSVG